MAAGENLKKFNLREPITNKRAMMRIDAMMMPAMFSFEDILMRLL